MKIGHLVALALTIAIAGPTSALEKRAVRVSDLERPDGWNAGISCTISYFNTCTGWMWAWSGWSPFDSVGVCYHTCCPGESGTLFATRQFTWSGAPSGRGFTGIAEIYDDVDGDCGGNGEATSEE